MSAVDDRWPRVPSHIRRTLSRVGRRGAYLIAFGTVYVLLGLGPVTESKPIHVYAVMLMPLGVWQWVFAACGVIAVAAGTLLPPPKAVGFAALQFVALAWGGSVLAAVLDPSVGGEAAQRGVLWLLVAVSTQIVSRLVEPSDLRALATHSTAGDHPAKERTCRGR